MTTVVNVGQRGPTKANAEPTQANEAHKGTAGEEIKEMGKRPRTTTVHGHLTSTHATSIDVCTVFVRMCGDGIHYISSKNVLYVCNIYNILKNFLIRP